MPAHAHRTRRNPDQRRQQGEALVSVTRMARMLFLYGKTEKDALGGELNTRVVLQLYFALTPTAALSLEFPIQ